MIIKCTNALIYRVTHIKLQRAGADTNHVKVVISQGQIV